MPKKKLELEGVVRRLLKKKTEISVAAVATAAGMMKSHEADRKAIRRTLAKLVDEGLLKEKGAARARVYSLVLSSPNIGSYRNQENEVLSESTISSESQGLLEYVSRPLQDRKRVGYNKNFLRSYEPNKSFYLSDYQRKKLLDVGIIENKSRPAGTYARTLLNRLLIDLSWNSSRLEGNTYSILETKRLVELGEEASGKSLTESQMILNHKQAIEYLVEVAAEKKITGHEVCSLHALLSENLLGDSGASGRLREISVGIAGTVYSPLDNPHVLKECFQGFLETLNLIKDPFEQSFFTLVHLSYLQAFEDVNKRTARLVSNIPLIKKNLCPLSFVDVDKEVYVKALLGIYERNDVGLLRDLYIWAYIRSAKSYSAIQGEVEGPNPLKLKHRNLIHNTIRSLVLEKTRGPYIVQRLRGFLEEQKLSRKELEELFKIIETEILSLHEGNIARFKIRPSEFRQWKKLQ